MQRRRKSHVRYTKSEWAAIIKKYDASGLTIKDYCEREGLTRSNFNRWRRKVSSSSPGQFVEITPPPKKSTPPWEIEVTLPHGVRLQFRG